VVSVTDPYGRILGFLDRLHPLPKKREGERHKPSIEFRLKLPDFIGRK
jgi:hypothetical protein